MSILDWASVIIGLTGFAYGTKFWIELRRWAHLIQYGRLVVAYKGKVKLNAPLQEWALWCKMAEREDKVNGRVIYHLGATRIAVLRKSFVPQTRLQKLIAKLTKPEGRKVPAGTKAADGTWSVAEDATKAVEANGH